MMELYAYTMTWDTGFAPCVWGGELTLACCKPMLRYKLGRLVPPQGDGEDIYVMGLCGKELERRGRKKERLAEAPEEPYWPVYLAKLKSAVRTDDYFSGKKRADQVYFYDKQADAWYVRRGNPHQAESGKKDIRQSREWDRKRDVVYRLRKDGTPELNYVLRSTEYIFWGRKPRRFAGLGEPSCLRRIAEARARAPRGDLAPIGLCEEERGELEDFFRRCLEADGKKVGKDGHIDPYFEGKCGRN